MDNKSIEEEFPKEIDTEIKKNYGPGIRHVQMTCLFFLHMVLIIARNSMGVVILAMTDEKRRNDTEITIYDWDKKTQGLIQSSFYWGYIVMQIPGGLLAKRYGGKPVLLTALISNGFFTLFLPVLAKWGGWRIVCVCRLLMGLTQSSLYPASHTLLGRWLPSNERTTYTGIVYSGFQIGNIIGMPISGLLAETKFGWQLVFYTTSIVLFITAIFWYCFSASTPAEHRMISVEERNYIEDGLSYSTQSMFHMPWRLIIRSKPLWAILVTHVGSGVVGVLFLVEMPTYLEKALHISLKSSAFVSAVPYMGMWIGSVVSSSVCEKLYNRGLLSVGACRKLFNSIALFGIAACLICLSFTGPEQKLLSICALVVALTAFGSCSAGFMVNHLDLSPNYAGVLLSITNFVCGIGNIMTPVTSSCILSADPTDVKLWRIVFLGAAVICILSNVVYLVYSTAERQKWDDPHFEDKEKADQAIID